MFIFYECSFLYTGCQRKKLTFEIDELIFWTYHPPPKLYWGGSGA